MKIIKKDNKASVRYTTFESAEKVLKLFFSFNTYLYIFQAYLNDHELILEFLDKNLLNFLKNEEKVDKENNITETENNKKDEIDVEISGTYF